MQAALDSMPMSLVRVIPRRVPEWTQEIILANNERKRALRQYQRTRLVADKITCNRARTRAILIKNRAQKESWKSLVSTLTEDTLMTKAWSRVRMTATCKQMVSLCLKYNNKVITDKTKVANILANHYENIIKVATYSPSFQQQNQQLELQHLDFSAHQRYPYNDPITKVEIV